MTVGELGQRMTGAELREWMGLWRLRAAEQARREARR